MKLSKINIWLHGLANEGSEIIAYRNEHKRLSRLPAKKIEILLQLRKLKQQFLNT